MSYLSDLNDGIGNLRQQIVQEAQAAERGRVALEKIAAKYTEKFQKDGIKATYPAEFRVFLAKKLGYIPSDITIDFIVRHYV